MESIQDIETTYSPLSGDKTYFGETYDVRIYTDNLEQGWVLSVEDDADDTVLSFYFDTDGAAEAFFYSGGWLKAARQ